MFFLFFIIFHKVTLAYKLNLIRIHNSKSITSLNGYDFAISEANSNWQDSLGNYSKSKKLFYIESKENGQTFIKGLGKLDDQNKNKIWFVPIRKRINKQVLETFKL